MLITKVSHYSGKTHTLDVPVTLEQLEDWRTGRKLIQHAMPQVPKELREFIKTGITPEEWVQLFGAAENE